MAWLLEWWEREDVLITAATQASRIRDQCLMRGERGGRDPGWVRAREGG